MKVASGHDSERAGDVGGTAICDDDSIARDAVITEHHSGSAEAARAITLTALPPFRNPSRDVQ